MLSLKTVSRTRPRTQKKSTVGAAHFPPIRIGTSLRCRAELVIVWLLPPNYLRPETEAGKRELKSACFYVRRELQTLATRRSALMPEQQTPPSPAPSAEKSDVESNKALAIVGYIFPILFFIPLLNESSKNSPFAKFHANQQLVLLISAFAVQVVGMFTIPLLIGLLILPVGWLFILVCAIIGLMGAANGQMKKLPLLGNFTILK